MLLLLLLLLLIIEQLCRVRLALSQQRKQKKNSIPVGQFKLLSDTSEPKKTLKKTSNGFIGVLRLAPTKLQHP